MTARPTLLVSAFLLSVAVPVQAQRQATPEQRIEAVISAAQAGGIPADLLRSRVAEGRAKRVPMDRIAAAVERRAATLRGAGEALTNGITRPSAAELSAGADALEAGVAGADLRAIAAAAGGEERAVALAVLGELVRQGIPASEAMGRVAAALQQRGDALSNLPRQAASERGNRPASAGPPAGVGGRPGTAGPDRRGGPPAGVPGAGQKPGQQGGRPTGPPPGNQ
jgi:hypothetical protein